MMLEIKLTSLDELTNATAISNKYPKSKSNSNLLI